MNNNRWDLIAIFIEVARAGSFSAAAKTLGLSQPTVSRRVQTLEESLGLVLFARHSQGFELTEEAEILLDSAAPVEDSAQTFWRRATSLSSEPTGAVRISASEPVAGYLLPRFMARFICEHPAVQLEVVPSSQAADLLRREADIAVRMFQPRQPDLVARQVGQVEIGFFAHESYLEIRGTPKHLKDLKEHTLIGYDRDEYGLAAFRKYGGHRELLSLRTDSLMTQCEAIAAGVGIGAAQRVVMAHKKGVQPVLPELELGPLPVWLVVHPDLRASPAIRLVFDLLAEFFQKGLEAPTG